MDWVDHQATLDLFISAVTKAEIEVGIALLPDAKRKTQLEAAAPEVFAGFAERCLPFDRAAASAYARVVVHRTRSGAPISVEDAQIAAIAVSHNLALATRSLGDFQGIEGLRVVDPWDQG